MAKRVKTYGDVRNSIQPGDVIAFGGKGEVSDLIKWVTRSSVSHVGIVVQTLFPGQDGSEYAVFLVEALFSGVQLTRLSARHADYDGEMWWLPLGETARHAFDLGKFGRFVHAQIGKRYDYAQAMGAGVDFLDRLGVGHNREDLTRLFCSELATRSLEAAGALPDVNASEVTPADLAMFRVYADDYVQLKGDAAKDIKGYNSVDPTAWGH